MSCLHLSGFIFTVKIFSTHFKENSVHILIAGKEIDCSCNPYKSCAWSKDFLDKLSELERGSKDWKNRYQFFRERICEKGKRNVYCCSDEQKAPDNYFLEKLKNLSLTTPVHITSEIVDVSKRHDIS